MELRIKNKITGNQSFVSFTNWGLNVRMVDSKDITIGNKIENCSIEAANEEEVVAAQEMFSKLSATPRLYICLRTRHFENIVELNNAIADVASADTSGAYLWFPDSETDTWDSLCIPMTETGEMIINLLETDDDDIIHLTAYLDPEIYDVWINGEKIGEQ